jgi:DNA-binding transcriptional LysR family regulator
MNLKHIEAFRSVMLAGSMTAAAKELFTSQPNISRLITQLERETGLLLFLRSGVRLIPTSEGNAFFREVERAYVGLQGLTNAAAQIKNLGTGRLRIAAMPSAGLTLVPHAIQRFQALHPEVTISLHVNTSGTVNHWTSSQFCDLGVAERSVQLRDRVVIEGGGGMCDAGRSSASEESDDQAQGSSWRAVCILVPR